MHKLLFALPIILSTIHVKAFDKETSSTSLEQVNWKKEKKKKKAEKKSCQCHKKQKENNKK